MKRLTKDSIITALQIVGIIGLLSYSAYKGNPASKEKVQHAAVLNSAVELRTNMHNLWEEHVAWTRNVMLCVVDELPGTDQAIKRLQQNKTDIGNAIKPYYGVEAGDKLTEFLYTHNNIALEVVKAAKAGNTLALEQAKEKWYVNADAISEFLGNENPYWAFADMKLLIKDHLLITTDLALQRIQKNYTAEVITYDKANSEILKMADILTDGIAKQFPEKFIAASTK